MDKNKQKKEQEAIKEYLPNNLLPLEKIVEMDKRYILNTYDRMPISFVCGSGEFLYDYNQKEYIDMLGGIAVNSLGYGNPDIIASLNTQSELIWHSSNMFYSDQQVKLARALVELTFPSKVFFCNSGTEAIEAAVKLIRAYSSKFKNRTKIIALENSFHGRTFGSMSVTGQEKIQNPYKPLLNDIVFIEPNNIDDLVAACDDTVAGMIIEPILGEGGIIPLTPKFVDIARELTEEYEILLVLDEIQTGIGRTGKYFCYEHYNIVPDAITLAKGLGGGFPIGALVVSEKYTDIFQLGYHGSTFGGNHLATSVGYEVLRTIECNKLVENAKKIGIYLKEELEKLQTKMPNAIKEIRGLGLMVAIELHPTDMNIREIVKKFLIDKNIVMGRAGTNSLRLTPPLILRKFTCDRFLKKLEEGLSELFSKK